MKKLIVLFSSLFLLTIAAQNVNAQANSANVTDAEASATIITPITLAKSTALNFGNIIPSSGAGTVTMSTAGARSTTNDVTLQPGVGGAAAVFTVEGLSDAAYSITLPASSVTLTNTTSGNSETMTVESFNHDAGDTPTIESGSVNFEVGATLNVGADQAEGTYTGTYAVTVAYN